MPKLSNEDRADLLEVHTALVDCLSGLPERLMASEKFGLLAVNAMFNIISTIAVNSGTEKEEILRGLEQVLDGRISDRKGVLN